MCPARFAHTKPCLEERPDLRGKITLNFLTESVFDDVRASDFTQADVLMLDTMNQQMLDRFNEKFKTDLIASVKSHGKAFAIGEGLLPKDHYTELGALWDDRAREYWANSGYVNQLSLMKYALQQAGVTGLTFRRPSPVWISVITTRMARPAKYSRTGTHSMPGGSRMVRKRTVRRALPLASTNPLTIPVRPICSMR